MSNNMNTPPTIRWQLLSTVSALALLGSAYTATAEGADADRPLIWVELGGQLENVNGQGAVFAPAFLAANPNSSVLWSGVTPLQAQQPPKFAFGEEGKISFQPEDSDWVFSVGALFGRSGDTRHVHHQTYRTFVTHYVSGARLPGQNPRAIDKFADTHAGRSENHEIIDFQVGKDVGLGMFGKDSSSVVSLGVRFAHFTSTTSFNVRARPEVEFKYAHFGSNDFQFPYYQTFYATGQASRSFHGVGPSLSWNGSAPFVGNQQDGELTFDWGANAALLFGKQKARIQHQASEHYVNWTFAPAGGGHYTGYPAVPHPRTASRSVTVPDVGGSVGLSWRVQDFKVSMGYRADFFFGAMDTGIDAVKKSTASFNGPYASISIGLGN